MRPRVAVSLPGVGAPGQVIRRPRPFRLVEGREVVLGHLARLDARRAELLREPAELLHAVALGGPLVAHAGQVLALVRDRLEREDTVLVVRAGTVLRPGDRHLLRLVPPPDLRHPPAFHLDALGHAQAGRALDERDLRAYLAALPFLARRNAPVLVEIPAR